MDYKANTLIIGLGGLGGQVLRDVRKRMFEEGLMGAKATQPLPVGFLYVDASDELMYPNDPQWWTPDGQDAQISLSEFLHINYNGGERIAKNLNYFPQLKEFAEHCQDLAFCQPNCGAMQNRRCGRILFASNVTAFRNAVTAKAGDLKSMTHCYGLHRVFIVASLSGGTGSGTIVDVIAQVSKLYPEARIYVLSALPDKPLMVYETGKLMANAYAALRELNALNIGEFQPFDITAPTLGGTIDADRQQPFLLIPFALSDFRDTTSLTDSLYYLLTADDNEKQVLHRLHSLEVWMRTECDATPSESYHVARTRALASLSLKRIFYPRERILNRVAYTLLGQSLQQMLYDNYLMERGFVREIKEIDLQIREHQTVINQLRERKQKLIAAHRKKRKPAWDSETPLYRLVNLQQYASGCVPCDERYITKKLPESLEISKIVPIFATSEHMFWLSGQNPEVAGHLKFHDRSKTSR